MLRFIIQISLRHRGIVIALALGLLAWGSYIATTTASTMAFGLYMNNPGVTILTTPAVLTLGPAVTAVASTIQNLDVSSSNTGVIFEDLKDGLTKPLSTRWPHWRRRRWPALRRSSRPASAQAGLRAARAA